MKNNQTDIIISIVALFLAVVAGVVFMFTAKPVTRRPDPTPVVTKPAEMPAGTVVYTKGLGGGSTSGQGGAGPQRGGAPGAAGGAPGLRAGSN